MINYLVDIVISSAYNLKRGHQRRNWHSKVRKLVDAFVVFIVKNVLKGLLHLIVYQLCTYRIHSVGVFVYLYMVHSANFTLDIIQTRECGIVPSFLLKIILQKSRTSSSTSLLVFGSILPLSVTPAGSRGIEPLIDNQASKNCRLHVLRL